MQWIILLCGLLMLYLLTRKKRVFHPQKRSPVSDSSALYARLSELARQSNGYGYARVPQAGKLLNELEDCIRYLNRFSGDALLPAARPLCANGRMIQEKAAEAILARRKLPKLPRSQERVPRAWLFAQEVAGTSDIISADLVKNALAAWQDHTPMTAAELDALPSLLSLALLETLRDLAQQCRQDQQAQHAASQAHLLHKHGKTHAAQKMVRIHSETAAFWEALLRLEEPAEWMGEVFPHPYESPEQLAREQHRRQAETSRWIENGVQSLVSLSQMPWNRLTEEASIIHRILSQDAVYQKMDAESRSYYRLRAAWIARRCRRSERAVCDAALALCRSADAKTVASHVGFYLLDDGYPVLLSRLHALTPLRRLEGWIRRQGYRLFQIASWIAFTGLLAIGFFSGYAIAMLVPFAIVFLLAAQQCALRWRQKRPRMVPRVALEKLPPDEKVLAVCPVALTDVHQTLVVVKQLSVMHEANPDQHLHFMLLGDFQDSLTATIGTDAEIMAAASSAVEALRADTGHPFFYLQRERSYSPGERSYFSRERRRGAVETLLCLLQGRSIQDRFAYADIDPALLRGQYRYVICLDGHTVLSPGSVLQMVGAMIHPLQKRQTHEGRTRGVSMLKPRLETAAHQMKTPFSRWLCKPCAADTGACIIDPEPYLNAVQREIPEGRILNPAPLEESLAGCASAADIVLPTGCPQTLDGCLFQLHSRTRGDWQLLPCLLPVVGYSCGRKLSIAARFAIRRRLLQSLLAPLQLLVLLYAAFTGREWLLAVSALLPQLSQLFPLSRASCRRFGMKLAILPCEAFVQADAIARTLYRLTISRQHLMEQTPAIHLPGRSEQPSMLFFSINMTLAGLFAAFPLILNGAWSGMALALCWAAFPFLLPVLEQPETAARRPSEYMRDSLLRVAQHTLLFFETAITDSDHGLPPASVQIEPNKGISHRTSSADVGLYLCSLIAAHKLKLLSTEELGRRIDEALHSLEALPKWHGLPYRLYDTQTLASLSPEAVSSSECGLLAVSLMTCAQGLRTLLPELSAEYHDLPLRLDQLCSSMQLDRLYDPEAGLFYVGLNPIENTPSAAKHNLLASESRLLSFVSIMLRKIPVSHWKQLGRSLAPSGALISPKGAMAEYMVPLLFQPLIRETLLERSTRKAFRVQRRHRLGGAFGISTSGFHAFDSALNYLHQSFGLPELSMDAAVESDVLAPYASMLCLSMDLNASFLNLQRLQRLGLEGPLGLFEAADFSPVRTEGKTMAVVRSHTASHQGMILCAICNALCDGYIANLFSDLPRAQAYRMLLEETPGRRRKLIRHPLGRQVPEAYEEEPLFKREAVPLAFPIDAHLLCGQETSLLIDAQGGGYFKHGEVMLTRFHESCLRPSGMRLYLRDSESGTYWTATDPYLTRSVQFEASQAVFQAERFDIHSELRVWINPLDGSCIHCLTLINRSEAERVMEVCSYLEPDLSQSQTACSTFHTERLGRHGVSAARGTMWLWQLLSAQMPLSMFRIQTDRTSFLGRGRGFLAPRAMELPISAVADSLGSLPDACLSLRGQFVLPPKGTAVLSFVTRLADQRENEAAFCDRYAQTDDILRTYDSALTSSRVTARYLRLTESMQASISRIPGALAYQNQPAAHPAAASLHSVREFEKLGLFGDAPMLLYTCCGSINEPLLALLLNAHSFCHLNGFAFDLVVLLEDCSQHMEMLADAQTLIDASHSREWQKQKGGVHLLNRLSTQEEEALRSMARLTVSAGGGTLEQQLQERFVSVRARPVYMCRSAAQWKHQLPEANKSLLFPNGYGGFLPESGDYQITLAPGRMTPAPWRNPLFNARFGTMAAESGLLSSWIQTDDPSTITECFSDDVSPRGEEQIFLRDSQNKLIWSLTRLPLGHNAAVRITHAPGETAYESSGYGIYARMNCFTDAEAQAGLRVIHLQNDSPTERSITLFHTCRFPSNRQSVSMTCAHDRAWGFLPHAERWAGLCAVDPPRADTAGMPGGLFQGLWRNVPFALSSMERLPQAGGDTAILSCQLQLKPGESRTITTALLTAETQEAFDSAIAAIQNDGATKRLLSVRRLWESRLGILQFDLPDQALNLLLGRWLPYQVWSAASAELTRNSPSILLALMTTQPGAVRAQLPTYASQAAALNDKLILICVAAAYVESAKDESILAEVIPSSTNHPQFSLHEWCMHTLASIGYGAHDLPVTEQGIENVCTGMLLCEAIRRFAPCCDDNLRQDLTKRRDALLAALERSAWDGAWYLYGWDSKGRKLCGAACEECRIALLPQCLAVICGASRERCETAMERAWQLLYERDAGLMKAAEGTLPDAYLNEAQDTAAACFAMSALHQLGWDEQAWELLGALMPPHHTATRQLAARYRTEPYAMPGLVYASTQQRGRAGQPWNPEAAACFLYVVTNKLLGLRIRGKELRFRPVVPQGWDRLRITYRHGDATYHLHADRSCLQPTADGEPLPDGILILADDGKIHEAVFPIRA